MKKLTGLIFAGVMSVGIGAAMGNIEPPTITETVTENVEMFTDETVARSSYEDIQHTKEIVAIPVPTEVSITTTTEEEPSVYSAKTFYKNGVIYWGDYKWTWYSEKVLPGGGLYIPGRHTDENGYICDENDYICLASNTLSKGAVVPTPFGKMGKVYDCGCDVGTMDTYVNW